MYVMPGLRLNYHLSQLIGLTSILWAGHLIHVAIPSSRGVLTGTTNYTLDEFNTARWISYAIGVDQPSHIHGSSIGSGESILTFIGSMHSTSNSLQLTDISHHHLALGVISIWSGQMYTSISKGLGNRMRELVNAYGSSVQFNSLLMAGGYELELSIALSAVSVTTSLVAQHMYSIPAYVYLASDYTTVVALYVHHQWIASILMLGSLTHAAIYLVREYTPVAADCVIMRIKKHKGAIVSHLSWVSQWLGFHTLFIYSHNDTVNAFAASDKSIMIEPVYAQIVQSASGKSIYGTSIIGGVIGSSSVNQGIGSLLLPIGPTDMIAHHAIAFGLHVTVLILVKAALDGRGSRMLPDKVSLGFGYPCDGPGRGGTCDISCWDGVYLASFWVLNTVAWALFYFHWKHLTLWQNISVAFQETGGYLLGWFRDYLWFNSAPLIRGYSASSVNDTSVWSWIFLGAHLVWATGFMFLISWRGYWQELIESIIYMHVRTPIVSDIWSGGVAAPVALSIVQARMVGLVHFAVGFILTYSAFVIATTK
jgi:photosystem I P700 chlorophyll a apoprotein A2